MKGNNIGLTTTKEEIASTNQGRLGTTGILVFADAALECVYKVPYIYLLLHNNIASLCLSLAKYAFDIIMIKRILIS